MLGGHSQAYFWTGRQVWRMSLPLLFLSPGSMAQGLHLTVVSSPKVHQCVWARTKHCFCAPHLPARLGWVVAPGRASSPASSELSPWCRVLSGWGSDVQC